MYMFGKSYSDFRKQACLPTRKNAHSILTQLSTWVSYYLPRGSGWTQPKYQQSKHGRHPATSGISNLSLGSPTSTAASSITTPTSPTPSQTSAKRQHHGVLTQRSLRHSAN